MRHLQSLWATILNILFPPVCVSCKKEGDFFCIECQQGLSKRKIRPFYNKSKAGDAEFEHLDGVVYALDYAKNPTIQAAIKQLKYKFTEELADTFARLVAEKVGELGMVKDKKIVLIPVPLHKKRLNYRGFNQAEIISNAALKHLPDSVRIDALQRTRHTDQQAKLNKHQRHQNLSGAFEIRCPLNNSGEESIHFIVDDVCTTGATLEQCAKTLKEAGISKVYGLVIARAFAPKTKKYILSA